MAASSFEKNEFIERARQARPHYRRVARSANCAHHDKHLIVVEASTDMYGSERFNETLQFLV